MLLYLVSSACLAWKGVVGGRRFSNDSHRCNGRTAEMLSDAESNRIGHLGIPICLHDVPNLGPTHIERAAIDEIQVR